MGLQKSPTVWPTQKPCTEMVQGFVFLVGVKGLEPSTLWSQTRCSSQLSYTPIVRFYPCREPGSNWRHKALQASALPLSYLGFASLRRAGSDNELFIRCLFLNARPEFVFKYFSNWIALSMFEKEQKKTSRTGLLYFVLSF